MQFNGIRKLPLVLPFPFATFSCNDDDRTIKSNNKSFILLKLHNTAHICQPHYTFLYETAPCQNTNHDGITQIP